MASTSYVFLHSRPVDIIKRVRRGFMDAWPGVDGVALAESGTLTAEALNAPACRAVAVFASDAGTRARLEGLRCPVWNYSHRLDPLPAARNLLIDDEELGALAATFLLAKGYRHFGFIADEDTAFARHRRESFSRELAAQGFGVNCLTGETPKDMSPIGFWARRQETIRAWVETLPPPAGIFAANDGAANLFLSCLQGSAPDLLPLYAVLGVDNTAVDPIGSPAAFSITSIEPNFHGLGEALAEEIAGYLRDGEFAPGSVRRISGARLIERESTGGASCENPLVARLMRRIQSQILRGEAPSVAKLSSVFGTSSRTLLTHFSRETGQSLRDYILGERLNRAAHLLNTSTMNIGAIAYACGFNKQSALSENFVRRFGCTPRDFRARGRDEAERE